MRVGAGDSGVQCGLVCAPAQDDGAEVAVVALTDSQSLAGVNGEGFGVLLDDPGRKVTLEAEEVELSIRAGDVAIGRSGHVVGQ